MITEAKNNLFHTVLEKLPMAVLLIDTTYRHIYTNLHFRNQTNLKPSLIAGLGWTHCMPLEERQSLFSVLCKMKDSDSIQSQTIPNFFLPRNISPPLTIAKEINEEFGEFFMLTFPLGFPQVDPSFTEEKTAHKRPMQKSYEEINHRPVFFGKTQAELIASNKHKDKVLAIISHDMNAPIASLKGLTDALLDTSLPPHERTALRISLLKQLNAVADLTENVLLWATNSFHNAEFEKKEPLDILQVIENYKLIIEQQASVKDIRITYDIPSGLLIQVNKDQFCTVMRNLLTNAIKYTEPKGEIHIAATFVGTCVQISITDTGIGISDEQQHALFTFSQTNTFGTHGEKGIGLGLLLCKQFVEANGGHISVRSKVNVGTTVTTQFPRIQ